MHRWQLKAEVEGVDLGRAASLRFLEFLGQHTADLMLFLRHIKVSSRLILHFCGGVSVQVVRVLLLQGEENSVNTLSHDASD